VYLQKATCSWHNVVQHLSGWMHMGWHKVSHIPFWIDTRWWCRILMRLFNIFMALCIPVKWAATAFPPGGLQSFPISSKHDNSVRRSLIWNLKNSVTLKTTLSHSISHCTQKTRYETNFIQPILNWNNCVNNNKVKKITPVNNVWNNHTKSDRF